tara:strand:- start:263 stop:622 length:360 start_codon:yes stop_codon:yes gene_type:complete
MSGDSLDGYPERPCTGAGALWPWRGLIKPGLAANRFGDSWGVAPSLCSAQIALRFVERQGRIDHPAHHTKQNAQRLLGVLLCMAAFGGQKKWMCTGRFYSALKVANASFSAMSLKKKAY